MKTGTQEGLEGGNGKGKPRRPHKFKCLRERIDSFELYHERRKSRERRRATNMYLGTYTVFTPNIMNGALLIRVVYVSLFRDIVFILIGKSSCYI
jgi:hypothetical protein